jgi:hypothetical protein
MKRWVLVASVGATCGIAFALGRASKGYGLLSRADPSGAGIATFSGGALGVDNVRAALTEADPQVRRAVVEQMVKVRLLALDAEAAGLHRTPEFLRRYSEELARLQIEKAFEGPFKKQLPTDNEVRRFFDENKARLGRPERVRLAHVALLAPATDAAGRTQKRTVAEKLLAEARRGAKDEYAFGRLALSVSEDKQSRPAAGELPFVTREELSARLGPAVAEAAFTAEPGRIIDRVIETDQGYQVVKILGREQGREASYDELREAIKARLTAERREKAFKEFMDALWARADVKIDEKALAELYVPKAEAPDR